MTRTGARAWGQRPAPIVAGVALFLVAVHASGWPADANAGSPPNPTSDPDPVVEPEARGGAQPTDAAPTIAGGDRAATRGDGTSPAIRAPMLYVPPSRGRARHTAGAGTRGLAPPSDLVGSSPASSAASRPRVTVLAPRDHVGRTASASPTLYWHLSAPTAIRIELTIVDDDAIEPVSKRRIPGPVAAGLHPVALEELGVELVPGKTYRWFVALVPDLAHRSRDELAEGAILRVEPAAGLASARGRGGVEPARVDEGVSAATMPPERSPAALREAALRAAEEGLWYDALAALSKAIEGAPADASLRADREALLGQIDLSLDPR